MFVNDQMISASKELAHLDPRLNILDITSFYYHHQHYDWELVWIRIAGTPGDEMTTWNNVDLSS